MIRNKLYRLFGIRFKTIMAFIAATILSTITIGFVMSVLALMLFEQFHKVLEWMNRNILITLIGMTIIYILITVGYYWLLTLSTMRYFERIKSGLHQISNGEFDIVLPLLGKDELTELALDVNNMAYKLKYYEEAKRTAEVSKERLTTNISHDIRTPLTSMLGYMKLIADGKYDDEESMRNYVAIALSKGQELQQMMESLFEYNKLLSMDYPINMTSVSLNELIEQAAVAFVPIFNERGNQCIIEKPEAAVVIKGDASLLARAVTNLLSNAAKFSDEGSDIVLRLKENKEGYATINVINHGSIIEQPEQIFERFYVEDIARTDRNKGSGLGLPITKEIIKKHQGTISVSSHEGITDFEIKLPIRKDNCDDKKS